MIFIIFLIFSFIWWPSPLLGINPASIRGTDTGVWIGVSGSEAGEAFSVDPEQLLGYSMTGCQRAMFANRISYFFDFKGKFASTEGQWTDYLMAGQMFGQIGEDAGKFVM